MGKDMGDNRVTTREFYDKLTQVELRLLARLDNMCDDIRDLQLSKAELEGKADQRSIYVAYLMSILSLAMAGLSLYLATF
jgi:hypothetical protein